LNAEVDGVSNDYIVERNGGLYVGDTRVSLASVVHAYREGSSPEGILTRFPALRSLENVHGAIAFILENEASVERYLAEMDKKWREFAREADPLPPSVVERLWARNKKPSPA
jgi:uncharacterized protein (DUF433 family)